MESKRRSPRTVLNRILCIQIGPDNHAIVVDISDDGLGFHAVYPVTDSGLIHFSFQNPFGRRVKACAELVWTDPTKKRGGLRFVYLPQLRREPLRAWIAEAQSPHAPEGIPRTAQAPAPSHLSEDIYPSVHPSALAHEEIAVAPRPDEWSSPRPRHPRAASGPEPPPPNAHWPLHSPSQPDDAVRPSFGQRRPRVVPAPAKPGPKPDGPGFVPLRNDLFQDPSLPDPHTHFVRPRSRFFPGFLTGVFFCAVVAAILLFAYGNPFHYLQTLLNTRRSVASAAQLAPPAPQLTPSAPPPESGTPSPALAPQPPASPALAATSSQATALLPSRGNQPIAGTQDPLTVDSGIGGMPAMETNIDAASKPQPRVSTAALNPDAGSDENAMAMQPARQSALPPSPTGTPPSASPVVAPDPGREDLALAQRYLGERNSTADRIAANFLWAAVRKGSVVAELTLADLYARGDGVQKNCSQARVLLQAAAQNGDSQDFQDLAPSIRRTCR